MSVCLDRSELDFSLSSIVGTDLSTPPTFSQKGNLLILAIGLAAVGFAETQSPSTLGVVLTYALSITQSLSMMVQQFAQLEQDSECF